jgi:hypothetical protein
MANDKIDNTAPVKNVIDDVDLVEVVVSLKIVMRLVFMRSRECFMSSKLPYDPMITLVCIVICLIIFLEIPATRSSTDIFFFEVNLLDFLRAFISERIALASV